MNTLPTYQFQNGELVHPMTACNFGTSTRGNGSASNTARDSLKQLCLQEYIAVRMYEDSTQGWQYVITQSFPFVVIILAALVGIGMGRWMK